LPFNTNNIDLVKKAMIIEKNSNYILRAKTGWAIINNINIGWYVGYIENGNNPYIFVLNVESDKEDSTKFKNSRKGITKKY
jgi:beta-lactamase class D